MTADGVRVRVLANAATAAEVRRALAAGAEGVGLLRTELAFLDAPAWPSEAAHRAALEPVLARARRPHGDRPRARLRRGQDAAVPAGGTRARGIALLLGHPARWRRSCARSSPPARTELRVLLPLVATAGQLDAVRRCCPRRQLGAMIETRAAVAAAPEIAARGLPLDRDQRPHRRGARRRPLRPGAAVAHDRACWPRSPPP